MTNITAAQLDGVPRDERVTVTCDGHKTVGIYNADHNEPAMTLLAMLNRKDQLEIALVGESANAFLGIGAGSPVVVAW